jgi:hypothetical protein
LLRKIKSPFPLWLGLSVIVLWYFWHLSGQRSGTLDFVWLTFGALVWSVSKLRQRPTSSVIGGWLAVTISLFLCLGLEFALVADARRFLADPSPYYLRRAVILTATLLVVLAAWIVALPLNGTAGSRQQRIALRFIPLGLGLSICIYLIWSAVQFTLAAPVPGEIFELHQWGSRVATVLLGILFVRIIFELTMQDDRPWKP